MLTSLDHFNMFNLKGKPQFDFITSRVSGRGNRIGAVFLCVCVSVCPHSHGQTV